MWDKEVNNHWWKSMITILQNNNTKIEGKKKIKSGKNKSKDPSKTLAMVPKFLYSSTVPGITARTSVS